MRPDNTAPIIAAAQRRHELTRAKAIRVLRELDHAGAPVTFAAVADAAEVSVSLLYTDHELATRIATARDRQHQAGGRQAWQLPVRSLVTEQSLRADLANAKEQIRQLTDEVTLLHRRLAHDLGANSDLTRGQDTNPLLAQLEERAAKLEAENHHLHRQAGRQDDQVRDLADTLDAARATNRDLMNQLNRGTAPRRRNPEPTEINKRSAPTDDRQ